MQNNQVPTQEDVTRAATKLLLTNSHKPNPNIKYLWYLSWHVIHIFGAAICTSALRHRLKALATELLVPPPGNPLSHNPYRRDVMLIPTTIKTLFFLPRTRL